MLTIAQELAQGLGLKVVPEIEWQGDVANGRVLDSYGTRLGTVHGGLLDGCVIVCDTAKHNCGAYEEDVRIQNVKGHWNNHTNGCWQMGHQRDEENTFQPEVTAELKRLKVLW